MNRAQQRVYSLESHGGEDVGDIGKTIPLVAGN